MTVYRNSAAVTITAALLAFQIPLAAQTTGILEAGPSYVLYDGFLASTAASATFNIQHDRPTLSTGARGGFTVFESGNQIFQLTGAAAWRTKRWGRWYTEVSGSAGIAQYANSLPYAHALGRVRLHLTGTNAGGWLGVATGASSNDSTGNGSREFTLGAWTIQNRFSIGGTIMATEIPPDGFVDVTAYSRLSLENVKLDLTAGVRSWRTQPDFEAYGEITARIKLNESVDLTVGGGRVVSDPLRGLLGATYASAGLRINVFGQPAQNVSPLPRRWRELEHAYASPAHTDRVRIALTSFAAGTAVTIKASGVRSVEIMGDFTDWTPVICRQIDGETWEVPLSISTGVYRINVRYDDGPWIVPEGVRIEENEFGGTVGIIVIP